MAIGRNEEFYEGDRDEVLSTGGVGETMQEVLARRWSRRGLVKGALPPALCSPPPAGTYAWPVRRLPRR